MYALGPGFGFHQLSPYQPLSTQQGMMPAAAPQGAAAQVPAHNTAASPAAMPAGYLPVAASGFLSAGYFAAAPQMAAMAAGAPAYASPAAGNSDAGSAGHVTANSTNALASAGASGSMAGLAPLGSGMGMAGMMAMPVGFAMATPVILMPVFFVMAGVSAPSAPVPAPAADADTVPNPVPESVPKLAPESKPDLVDEAPVASQPPNSQSSDQSSGSGADDAVVQVDAESFSRFRQSQLSAELNTSLVLQLTTLEGDSISLDFSQLDTFERVKMNGKTLDGDRQRSNSVAEDSQRMVNMSVDGELSAAERESVDAVLSAVIEVANRFFNDDMNAAVEKLKMMDFDTSTLADFSLKMTMSKSVDLTTVAGGAKYDGLKRLADRDGEVSKVLEFFADQQRQLIESASEALDRPSAVKLVKSLLPPLLEAPLLKLADKVSDALYTADDVGSEETQPEVMPDA